MADKRIKGISIEIGGNTQPLQKALADVNKRSNALKSELKDVDRLLKFDPGNAEALAQKQKLLADQVELTTQKLEQLKQAEQQVQAQFKKGDISEEQYRKFRREIEFTEGSLDKLKKSLSALDDGSALKDLSKDAENAKESVGQLGGELASVAGALAAGGGIAGAIEQALDVSSLNTKIDISFDVPEKSKQSVKDAIKNIETYGIDGEAALEGVRRQWALNKKESDATNAAVVKGAAVIANTYAGLDFTELIQETNEIANELKISNQEALGLTNSLLKMGFPPEQLDIIAEYGAQLQRAGYTAQEIQALFAAGVDTGTWNIDNLLDGLKEGRIRVAEFGQAIPDALADVLELTDISTKQMQAWGEAVAKGGEGGSKAMVEIAAALNGIKDETLQNTLGVQIFGTMWEDQGKNITDTILNAKNATVDLKANQDALNESAQKLDADPAVKMKQAMNDLKTALAPVLTVIADIISKVANWISENPKLAATVAAVVTAIGTLVGICMALAPIFVTLSTVAAAAGVTIGALAAPIAIAVAAIAGIIAIGVLLYKNWDTIKAKAGELAQTIKQKFEEFKRAAAEKMNDTLQKIKDIWNKVDGFFRGISLVQIGKNIIQGLISGISSMASSLMDKARSIANSIKNTIKNALDIHSPSRVMMGLGENIGQGLSLGMENTVRLIEDAASQLSTAAIPTIQTTANQPIQTTNRISSGPEYVVVEVNLDRNKIAQVIAEPMSKELGFLTNQRGRGKGVIVR